MLNINKSKTSINIILILSLFVITATTSCEKYLDAKPNQSLTTPTTLEDLQGILNNYFNINSLYPTSSEICSDNYYLKQSDWSSLNDQQRAYYIWQKYNGYISDYLIGYNAIEYANILLESIPKVSGDENGKKVIRGNALFVRASYHYALAQIYCKPYDQTTAQVDLGIALQLTADISKKPFRSSVSSTYQSIISDLQNSLQFLPNVPDVKYHASKPAAYGALARVYLAMNDFKNAELYADSALKSYSTLIDYNALSTSSTAPFKQFNDEVIYDARTSSVAALSISRAKIDTVLYNSFSNNDLRKVLFFKSNADGSKAFKGNYTGLTTTSLFSGIASDELYFIKAESEVRNNKPDLAIVTLNTILATRWKKGTFVPLSVSDNKTLLNTILNERRKELMFRGLRWTDLRRLNKEEDLAVILKRNLGSTIYTLPPNSLRYVLQIHQDAVNISGLDQNP